MPEGAREGVLERRGPGIIGKWEARWFRLEGRTLLWFPAERGNNGGRHAAEGSTSLREVSNLALESDKCECTFVQTDGIKIRLRAKTAEEAQAWFSSLRSGQAWEEPEEPPPPDHDEERPLFDRVWPGDEQLAERAPGARGSPLGRAAAEHHAARRSRSCDGDRRQSPRVADARAAPQSPAGPGRLQQLHALHELKQRRLESRRLRLEAEEAQRIAEGREAMRQGTRGCLDPASLDPREAAQRLFKDRERAEERLLRLQLRLEEEERKRLQETRFRRGPARGPSDANAGVRLYEDHRRREQEKQARRNEKQEEAHACEKSMTRSTSTSGANYHEKLYDDAQHRREQLDRKLKERDAAEAKKLAEEAIAQRSGPVDMGCIAKLHGDHEAKLKKQALRVAQKQEKERQELEEAMRWGPRRGPSAPQQEPIWQRGKSAYFLGQDARDSDAAGKRSSPELATPVDVAIAAVAQAVQFRINDPSGLCISDLKGLGLPLRAMLALYGEAQADCEKGEGFPALCVRASQRLFRDCCLLPEFEGFEQCREPNPIHQVEEDLDALMRTAAKAQVALQEMFVPPPQGSDWRPGTTRTSIVNVQQALFAFNPGPKTRLAAETKARVLFQPAEGARRYRHLLDLARLTLVFASCDLLHAGLDEIIGKFEVVRVCNHFNSPTRLGERYIEVLLVISLKTDDGLITPHVCELRLEELSFYQARELAAPHLEEYSKALRAACSRSNRDMDALAYLGRATLRAAAESHCLRSFRRHLMQTFGSLVVAWRRVGGARLIPFERFRDLCHIAKCREYAPLLWSTLDPGCGGCISLFELAPEAMALLARLRAHIMALEQTEDPDDQALFERLTSGSHVVEAGGRIEAHEFGGVLKAWGFTHEDATRIFRHLDYQVGGLFKPPSSISVADVGWLRRLSAIVDLDAVLLCNPDALSEHQALRELARTGSRSRAKRLGAVPGLKRNSNFALRGEAQAASTPRGDARASSSGAAGRRSKSLEPASSAGRDHRRSAEGLSASLRGPERAGAGHGVGRGEGLAADAPQSAAQAPTALASAAQGGRGSVRASCTRVASPRGSLSTTVSPSAATTQSAASSPLASPAGKAEVGASAADAVPVPQALGHTEEWAEEPAAQTVVEPQPAPAAAPPPAVQPPAAPPVAAPPATVPPAAEPPAAEPPAAEPQLQEALGDQDDDYNAEEDDYNAEDDGYNAEGGHQAAPVVHEAPQEMPGALAEACDAEAVIQGLDDEDYNAEDDDYNAQNGGAPGAAAPSVQDHVEECF